MKQILLTVKMILIFVAVNAQTELNLTNKTFQQVDRIPNSTTELIFTSKTQVIYVITNLINGKTYIDRCPGNATLSGNKISINCNCEDKELYPDPIKDRFVYDSKTKTLTSTNYRSTDGVYIVWNMK